MWALADGREGVSGVTFILIFLWYFICLSPYMRQISCPGLRWASEIPANSQYSENCHMYTDTKPEPSINTELTGKILVSKKGCENVQDKGKT